VIIATLGISTVLRASPFPEWQDEAKPPQNERAVDHSIEEIS
jgi:hypothetical protein